MRYNIPCLEPTLEDHISYCKECIYDAYTEIGVLDENMFNLMKNEAIKEAIDDITTEPYYWGEYDFDTVMDYAKNDISFNEYLYYKNNYDY